MPIGNKIHQRSCATQEAEGWNDDTANAVNLHFIQSLLESGRITLAEYEAHLFRWASTEDDDE